MTSGRLGIVGARAEALIAIARAVSNGELQLGGGAGRRKPSRHCARSGYRPVDWPIIHAMRALAWPDAWPPQDGAAQRHEFAQHRKGPA